MTKILIVTTSHARMGDTERSTGLWFEELATPYWAFRDAGAEVTIASIQGGQVPIDATSMEGEIAESVRRFQADETAMAQLRGSLPVADASIDDFDAVFLPGGHGTMWDLPDSAALIALIESAWASGKAVAAVCHGPAGLVNVKGANGQPIVAGRRVSAFTNSEEEAVGLVDAVPFLLETRLRELGGDFGGAPDFQPYAVRDGQLVTGQNPASSEEVARLTLAAVREREPA
jgi:putative intracellular protease/amidase